MGKEPVIDCGPLKFGAQEGAYALCISSNTHIGKPGPIKNAESLFFYIVTFGDMKINLNKYIILQHIAV